MELRHLLKALLLPPGCFLLLLLLSLAVARRRALYRVGVILCVFGLWMCSTPWLADQLSAQLYLDRSAAGAGRAQAIVVLGGGSRYQASEFGAYQEVASGPLMRLQLAAHIQRSSGLPILLTGGFGYQPDGNHPWLSEAAVMARSLSRDFQVEASWLEERSRTTWENALFSAPLLRDDGIEEIVLVTEAFHMRRAVWCFESQGFAVRPLAVDAGLPFAALPAAMRWLPSVEALRISSRALHEWLGMAVYRLRYA